MENKLLGMHGRTPHITPSFLWGSMPSKERRKSNTLESTNQRHTSYPNMNRKRWFRPILMVRAVPESRAGRISKRRDRTQSGSLLKWCRFLNCVSTMIWSASKRDIYHSTIYEIVHSPLPLNITWGAWQILVIRWIQYGVPKYSKMTVTFWGPQKKHHCLPWPWAGCPDQSEHLQPFPLLLRFAGPTNFQNHAMWWNFWMSNSKYVQIWDQFGHLYLKVNVDFISFRISPTGRLVLKRQFKAKGHGTPSSHLSWGHVALLWSEGGQIWGSLPENGDFCGFHWVKPACIIFHCFQKKFKNRTQFSREWERKSREWERIAENWRW